MSGLIYQGGKTIGIKTDFEERGSESLHITYLAITGIEDPKLGQELCEFYSSLYQSKRMIEKLQLFFGFDAEGLSERWHDFIQKQIKWKATELQLQIVENQDKACLMFESEKATAGRPPTANEEILRAWIDQEIERFCEQTKPRFGEPSEEFLAATRIEVIEMLREELTEEIEKARQNSGLEVVAILRLGLTYLDNLPEPEDSTSPTKTTKKVFIPGRIRMLDELGLLDSEPFRLLDKKDKARFLAHLLQCGDRQVLAALNRETSRTKGTDKDTVEELLSLLNQPDS